MLNVFIPNGIIQNYLASLPSRVYFTVFTPRPVGGSEVIFVEIPGDSVQYLVQAVHGQYEVNHL
jgi:hypothetical protein